MRHRRRQVLKDFSIKYHNAIKNATSHADRYGVRKTILAQAKTINPWITESAFLHSIRKKPLTNNKKEIMDAAESLLDITRRESSQFSQSSTRDEDANTPTRKFDKINSKKSLKLQDEEKLALNSAINESCLRLAQEKKDSQTGRLKRNILPSIINEMEEKYGLSKNAISIETVRSRMKRGNFNPPHRGTPSPMASLEKEIVPILNSFNNVNRPLNCTEGLRFLNSVIANSKIGNTLAIMRAKGQNLHVLKQYQNQTFLWQKVLADVHATQ